MAAEYAVPGTSDSRQPAVSRPEARQSPASVGTARDYEATAFHFPEIGRPNQHQRIRSQPKSLPSILSVLFYVLIISSLFVAVLWFMKRCLPGHKQLFSHPALEVLGRSHLDQRRYVSLLRVGRRIIVVGVSQEGLSSLSEITDEEEITEILEVARPKAEMGLNLFQRLFQRHAANIEAARQEGEVENRAHALREEIAALRTRAGKDDFSRPTELFDRIG
ncbi:MAG: flagellar biosynthetic protein FliO [Planctomycetota bacterium]|jgi:flagellar biogenesis protein FliO|nr:flagellar biosynthetic protein FliO [Planctomycetota bacterium]